MIEVSKIGGSRLHDAFLQDHSLHRLESAGIAAVWPSGITGLSLQCAGEHCTECAAPDCHKSCDLFERSGVGRCRRFSGGLVAVPDRSDVLPAPYVLEAIFRPSARLLMVGNTMVVSRRQHRLWSGVLLYVSRCSYVVQSTFRMFPERLQWRITDVIRGMGNRLPRFLNWLAARGHGMRPDRLLFILGNPQRKDVTVEITVSGWDSQGGRRFQQTRNLTHGWQAIEIPVSEIAQAIDLTRLFRICLVPLVEQDVFLQIGYSGFVAMKSEGADDSSATGGDADGKVKLVVFDLDNTLWDGILLEDPDRKYVLRPGVRSLLEELDRRGILLSVASKNHPADAEQVLQRLGIWDLFLYPQVGWHPKSTGLQRIISQLNIGADSVVFIDDSEFERAEVAHELPSVRVYPDDVLPGLLDRPEFLMPITEESRRRREMYREEQDRHDARTVSTDDYDAFLRSCNMRLMLEPLNSENRERVYELVQRTNQLNFSGNRYSRSMLDEVCECAGADGLVVRCSDRFGDYGIVGFAIVSVSEGVFTITDMMFSCRVQGKRVEHAFIDHLVARAKRQGCTHLKVIFNETDRNKAVGQVFKDLGLAPAAAGESGAFVCEVSAFKHQPWPATITMRADEAE